MTPTDWMVFIIGILIGAATWQLIRELRNKLETMTRAEIARITIAVNALKATDAVYSNRVQLEWDEIVHTGKLRYSNLSAELREIITKVKGI